ncbi:MAG TPA: hypothetical protein VFA04_09495 [Bryobacteraceae bacterium]|nr:hypothetical protein [Bryobacteraceae bacterium]
MPTRTAAKRSREDLRLARLTEICLALPETTRCDMGSHASFLVRKRTYAYFLNDHHGDGIVSVAAKALPGDNELLVRSQPDDFICRPTSARAAGSRCGSTAAKSTGRRWPKW